MLQIDYAAIQRNLGLLEGLITSMPEPQQQIACAAIEAIDQILDEAQGEENLGKMQA